MRLKDLKQALKNLENAKNEYDFTKEVPEYNERELEYDIQAINELIDTAVETLLVLQEWEKLINKKR